MNLWKHRRGSVALMTGIMLPVMVMSLAMGIEVTSWSVTKVELQRIADVSAWAGAAKYAASTDPQAATNAAADLAEINGVSSASSRTWNPQTLTTTDNLITAQVVSGVKNAADVAIKVTVKRTIAKSFSRIIPSSQSSVTVSAVAVAEIVSTAPITPQPCLVALQSGGSGVTDITLNGSANVTSSDCSVRSNAGITLNGATALNVKGTYAGGAITIPSWNPSAIQGGTYPNSGQIPDPYAGYAPLQNAFSSLSSGGQPDPNTSYKTTTITPGTYSSLTLGGSSNTTLSPGTYIVNGNVTFAGAAKVTGNNVTIIFSGVLQNNGSASVSLTAPTSASGVGIPGILFAGNSSGASSFNGATSLPLAGVIYYPNGNISFNGSASANGSGCSEVIAGTITINGAANLSALGCSTYGTKPFGSMPASKSIALVQ